MLTYVPRKKTPRDITELPESFKSLRGFDQLVERDIGDDALEIDDTAGVLKSGTWRIQVVGANDPREAVDSIDPLISLALMANAAMQLDARLEEMAKFCRGEGKTWTQIGEALGMSKQAAWERFSGED